MTSEEQKQYDELIALENDSKFKELRDMIEGDNAVEFFEMSTQEIKHSRTLANLFNTEDYTWNGEFIEYFLKKADVVLPDNFDYNSLRVRTEYPVKNGRIDILLYSIKEKTVIVIENKVDADESKEQLSMYENGISSDYTFKDKNDYERFFYIFLTPDGRAPQKAKNIKVWKAMSYEKVIEMLNDLVPQIKRVYSLSPQMINILDQYKQYLRRKVAMDPMLRTLCSRINAKYPNAVDILLQYKESQLVKANETVAKEIERILYDLQSKNEIELLNVFNGSRGSKTFTFRSVNLRNRINKNGLNPVIYTIMIELETPEEILKQRYVCYGEYDKKAASDAYVENEIKRIYKRQNLSRRLLSQDIASDAIEINKAYDSKSGKLINNKEVEKKIKAFIDRIHLVENQYT